MARGLESGVRWQSCRRGVCPVVPRRLRGRAIGVFIHPGENLACNADVTPLPPRRKLKVMRLHLARIKRHMKSMQVLRSHKERIEPTSARECHSGPMARYCRPESRVTRPTRAQRGCDPPTGLSCQSPTGTVTERRKGHIHEVGAAGLHAGRRVTLHVGLAVRGSARCPPHRGNGQMYLERDLGRPTCRVFGPVCKSGESGQLSG